MIQQIKPHDTPCHHCENRFVGCHDSCGLYIAWNEEYQNNKKKYMKDQKIEAVSFIVKGMSRDKKRRRRK